MISRHCYRSAAVLVTLACLAAAPATGPGAAPTTQRSRIDQWLAQAADAEPAVREAARINLLGLTPDELWLLRDAALANGPLKPAQLEVIREAVIYVRTRAVMLQLPNEGAAVMGVGFGDGLTIQEALDSQPGGGVMVLSRLPGFVAARYLIDGDIILGVVIDKQTVWFESIKSLQEYVAQLQIGARMTMLIRRGAKVDTVSFPVDAYPFPQGATKGIQGTLVRTLALNAEADAVKSFEIDFSTVSPGE
ncbi:MAG: hypothetical protein JWM57_4106 [Phycisphaerales bacterium]|nr:hypothetical protein [Phycisphaerales bacterium]